MKTLIIWLALAGIATAQTVPITIDIPVYDDAAIIARIEAIEARLDAIKECQCGEDPDPDPDPDPPVDGELTMWDPHHMVPDFRPVSDTVVDAGTTATLTGDVGIVSVFGAVHFVGEVRYDTIAQYGGEITCDPDCHFIRTDTPLHPSDAAGRGGGIMVVGGTCDFAGTPVIPFIRSTAGFGVGSASIDVGQSHGWSVGDRVLFPHTRQNRIGYTPTWDDETRVITAVTPTTISFAALSKVHPSCPDNPWGIVRHPHVANLTRSLRFSSVNQSKEDNRRGHLIVVGEGVMRVSNASFIGMGRTRADVDIGPDNLIGSYDIHAHHVNGGLMEVTGCVFEGSLKWGPTIHQSTGCIVDDCVVYDADGAGIAFENGMEHDNFCRRNLVCRVTGGIVGGHGGGLADNRGANGSGIWASCAGNTIDDNVVYGTVQQAFCFTGYGANNANEPTLQHVSFSGNEAVGSYTGLWSSWSQGFSSKLLYQPQTWGDFTAWNCGYGLFAYHELYNTFESLTLIADPAVSATNKGAHNAIDIWGNGNGGRRGIGMAFNGYENTDTVVESAKVSGFNIGLYISTDHGDNASFAAELQNHCNVLIGEESNKTPSMSVQYLGHSSGPGIENANQPIPNTPTDYFVAGQ